MKNQTLTTDQTLAHIDLTKISVSETNKMFRDNTELNDEGLKELANSIIMKGVISPILLMPDQSKPGNYVLICGERRYKASMIAGKKEIPSFIREMSEQEAFELQITENLQRKDVHPIKEANGFKYIMERNPETTTAELGLRFGKSETYILQRLKLNDLIAEAKKDFLANKMILGHALIIAKLTAVHQKECIDEISNQHDGYGTVTELENYVSRQIMQNLSEAPFSKEDADLITKAGACTTCFKRSGASPMLFPELKQKDCCIDRNCFLAKCNKFVINKVKEAIETHPEVVLLQSHNDPNEDVEKLINEHKIKTLKQYNDFNTNDKSGAKAKGLWISGRDAGKTITIYLQRNKEALSGENANQQTLIAKIQERTKRAKELDEEKVYAKILEAFKQHPTLKKDNTKKMLPDEEIFLWFIVFDKAGFNLRNDLKKILNLNKEHPEKLYQALKSLTPEQKAILLRRVMMDQYGGVYPTHDHAYIIRKVAESHKDIPIDTFEAEQEEIRARREERAKQRIKQIREESKSQPKKKKTTKVAEK